MRSKLLRYFITYSVPISIYTHFPRKQKGEDGFPSSPIALIIPFRIIRCPFYKAHFLITSIGVMPLLMSFVLGIQLITTVVRICPIRFIVRVVLISPVIQLFLCVSLSRYLFHSILLSEPIKKHGLVSTRRKSFSFALHAPKQSHPLNGSIFVV